MTTIIRRIQLRRGSTAEWNDANPVLAPGEPGVDLSTGELKIGDGVRRWKDLPTVSADLDVDAVESLVLALTEGQFAALDARITALEQQGGGPEPTTPSLVVVNHGGTAGTARPIDAEAVLWVGDATPANAAVDLWFKAALSTGNGVVAVAATDAAERPDEPVVLWVGLDAPGTPEEPDLWLQADVAITGTSLVVASHGNNANLARPAAAVVLWVGDATPVNGRPQDVWLQPTPGVLLDLLNNPRVRLFVDDARLFVRSGSSWVLTPATPPTGDPGADLDDFDDRDAPLRFSFTRDEHLPWLTDDDDDPTAEWITSDGQAGLSDTPAFARLARFETGFDETTPHHIKVTLGDEPAAGFEVGVAAAVDGDSLIRLQHSDVFGDSWVFQAVTGPNLDASFGGVVGLEAAAGDEFIVEVGTDEGSGATYVLAVLPDGRRLGPFPLPEGYEGRVEQGMLVAAAGEPVTRIEIAPESVIADAPLSSTDFTGAAGSVHGYLDEQGHAATRTGTVLELDGNGNLHLATGVGVSVANHASYDVRRRDVDVAAEVATRTGPASVGPVACISDTGTEFLMAAVFANGQVQIVKRVGGSNTTLKQTAPAAVAAGDDTLRELRLVIRWPTVEVYYDGSAGPILSHDLTPTEQAELGGGVRTRCGVGLTKTSGNPSPICGSLTIRAAVDDLAPYLAVSEIGDDFYSENTYATNRTGPHIASDATHQVVVNPKVVNGKVRWFASIRELSDPDDWTHYEIDEFGDAPLDDNHNSCAVAIDGSGRIHISGNMHNNNPLLYVMSAPGHDLSDRTVVTQADIGGAWTENPQRFTYPQLLTLGDGNVVYSARNAVNTRNSVQLFALWDHDDETWLTPWGADGKVISGWELTTKYGVYAGRMEHAPNGVVHLNWTWAVDVGPGNGDFGKGAIFSDFSHCYVDASGTVRRAPGNAITGLPIRRFTSGVVAFDNEDQPLGMDHSNTCAVTASGQIHMLVPTASAVPFFRHLWHPGTSGGSWTEIGLPEICKARQLHILAYGNRVFGYGRPKGQDELALWDLTPGSDTYGEKLAVLFRTPLTNGYDPNHDVRRLRDHGILAVQVGPAAGTGDINGTYASTPHFVVEFDLAAAIDDGVV